MRYIASDPANQSSTTFGYGYTNTIIGPPNVIVIIYYLLTNMEILSFSFFRSVNMECACGVVCVSKTHKKNHRKVCQVKSTSFGNCFSLSSYTMHSMLRVMIQNKNNN